MLRILELSRNSDEDYPDVDMVHRNVHIAPKYKSSITVIECISLLSRLMIEPQARSQFGKALVGNLDVMMKLTEEKWKLNISKEERVILTINCLKSINLFTTVRDHIN